MSVESLIYATLKNLVSNRVYRDVAPADVTALPRIVFQQVAGEAINFLSGDRPSKKWARMQVSSWHSRRDDCMALARQVEDALRAETTLGTTVMGAPIAVYEPDTQLYGAHQDFTVAYDD